jgi:hypothetical protein
MPHCQILTFAPLKPPPSKRLFTHKGRGRSLTRLVSCGLMSRWATVQVASNWRGPSRGFARAVSIPLSRGMLGRSPLGPGTTAGRSRNASRWAYPRGRAERARASGSGVRINRMEDRSRPFGHDPEQGKSAGVTLEGEGRRRRRVIVTEDARFLPWRFQGTRVLTDCCTLMKQRAAHPRPDRAVDGEKEKGGGKRLGGPSGPRC